jgi:hypothetical protein
MFIFVVPTLQKKWNKIHMKELAGGKCMENDCFLRTLKFEMQPPSREVTDNNLHNTRLER